MGAINSDPMVRTGIIFKSITPISLGCLIIALIVSIACQQPPAKQADSAKAALDKAANAQALIYADSQYRIAQGLFREGQLEIARQQGRFALLRDFAAADSLFALTICTADLARDEAADRLNKLKSEAEDGIADLAEALSAWRAALDGSLTLYEAEKSWAAAKINLEASRLLLESSEYVRAIEAAKNGRRSLDELSAILEQYQNSEAQIVSTWRHWVDETLAGAKKSGSAAIIIDKSAHRLHLVKGARLVRSFPCDLGYNSASQKYFAGDGATPEGQYRISRVKGNGSKFYRALLLNYPNDLDKKRFKRNKSGGIISQNARIGALIEIHGEGNQNRDWTDGCIALENGDIDELFRHVEIGTPVTIVRRSDRWPK